MHRGTRPTKNNSLFNPSVSIVVPTIAGGQIMRRKLENILALDYPSEKLDVIIIDSSEEPFRAPKGVKVVHQERLGKPAALNLGIEVSTTDIIVITDDDAFLDTDALAKLTSCFSDPEVGGVAGDLTLGGKGTLNKMNSSFYSIFRNSLRKWESSLDSVSFTSGELFAFRKSIISEIDPKVLSDDLYLLFEIRKKGYRVVASEAKVFEEDVPSLTGQINHKRRTMIGSLQVFRKNLRVFFNPRYGLFGMLLFPMYLIRITICPVLLTVLEALLILQFPYFILILILLLFGFNLLKKDLGAALLYGLPTQVAALLGIMDFAMGNYGVGWRKKGK